MDGRYKDVFLMKIYFQSIHHIFHILMIELLNV
jgi:hypothetical protein